MQQKYHIDEKMFETAMHELLEVIQRQKTQSELEIEFDNGYFKAEEGYKYDVYKEGRRRLKVENWTEDMIGTHIIADNVVDALKVSSNLTYFMTKDFTDKIEENVTQAETILYKVYSSYDSSSDHAIFEAFVNFFGNNYNRTAYIFFLKDREKYLPIKPEKFKDRFSWLNIETDCCNGCTWEHYQEFIHIIKDVSA